MNRMSNSENSGNSINLNTMNPSVKQKWLADLRSGKRKQGRLRLRDGDKFCCLGVLCDIYINEHQDWRWDHQCPIDTLGEPRNPHYLPSDIVEWAGLSATNPAVKVDIDGRLWPVTLGWLNDEGKSFEEIADLIEVNL